MRRKKIIKISLYAMLGVLLVGIAAGGYVWYSVNRTMDAIYEPLPDKTWTQPVFEREQVQGVDAEVPPEDEEDKWSSESTTIAVSSGLPETATAQALGRTTDNVQSMKLDDAIAKRLLHPDLDGNDPFNILLLGVDERKGDRGRSDTMILLSVQPATKSAIAISIPRDTRVLLPQRESYDKINHAYAFGGSSLSVAAVERLLGVPIAYYMKTNMEGLVDIVDTVGGVDVVNKLAFSYGGNKFPLGEQHLNGSEALAFVQMRKEDPHGDFGRMDRQRQVLSSAVDKVVSFRSINKLPHILSQLSKDVRTNLTLGNMTDLASGYRSSVDNVETLYLNGSGKMINGIYYYIVQPEERKRIQERIIAHLQAQPTH